MSKTLRGFEKKYSKKIEEAEELLGKAQDVFD